MGVACPDAQGSAGGFRVLVCLGLRELQHAELLVRRERIDDRIAGLDRRITPGGIVGRVARRRCGCRRRCRRQRGRALRGSKAQADLLVGVGLAAVLEGDDGLGDAGQRLGVVQVDLRPRRHAHGLGDRGHVGAGVVLAGRRPPGDDALHGVDAVLVLVGQQVLAERANAMLRCREGRETRIGPGDLTFPGARTLHQVARVVVPLASRGAAGRHGRAVSRRRAQGPNAAGRVDLGRQNRRGVGEELAADLVAHQGGDLTAVLLEIGESCGRVGLLPSLIPQLVTDVGVLLASQFGSGFIPTVQPGLLFHFEVRRIQRLCEHDRVGWRACCIPQCHLGMILAAL